VLTSKNLHSFILHSLCLYTGHPNLTTLNSSSVSSYLQTNPMCARIVSTLALRQCVSNSSLQLVLIKNSVHTCFSNVHLNCRYYNQHYKWFTLYHTLISWNSTHSHILTVRYFLLRRIVISVIKKKKIFQSIIFQAITSILFIWM
jgi:hypothetical protein